MNAITFAIVLAMLAYLIGAIPFGYLIGRMRGIDLFREGSGNIGATNTARVLGKKWGLLVFLLDFAKGAMPAAMAASFARELGVDSEPTNLFRALAAGSAFLGHLFPIYLRFRGGKGVATGAGAVCVLAPGPTMLALLTWVVVFIASRTVSIASLAAVAALSFGGLALSSDSLASDRLPITVFLLIGSLVVIAKHRANFQRCLQGTEKPMIADSDARQSCLRAIHLLAVSLWFGGSLFFNFIAAPTIFVSFSQVVNEGASDRTAKQTIIPPDAGVKDKKALANALAGSAVGPIFPKYFAMQAICVALALATALAWWNSESSRRTARWRVRLLVLALLVVAVSWPLSNYVSELRPKRFDPVKEIAEAAIASFGQWHLVSLGLSFVAVLLGGAVVVLGAWLPRGKTV